MQQSPPPKRKVFINIFNKDRNYKVKLAQYRWKYILKFYQHYLDNTNFVVQTLIA